MTATDAALPLVDRRVHRALLDAVIATGAVRGMVDLAASGGMSAVEVEASLEALVRADYLGRTPAGEITCLYPFSIAPTPHVVVIDGAHRHAMCSIDALGVAAMLGRAVAIEGGCAECGAVLRVEVEPGRIVRAVPAETVVVARRSGAEQACEVCCPGTLFACRRDHAEVLASRSPATEVVPLGEALGHAEAILARLLDETLPAQRPRSRVTTALLRT